MVPPWQKFPHIPAGSIGWRMGEGEDYWRGFDEWFKRKNPEAKVRYAADNPEPPEWGGFYHRRGVPA